MFEARDEVAPAPLAEGSDGKLLPPPRLEPLPRIEVVGYPRDGGYFRVSTTGERFTPRGNNYIRLSAPTPPRYHSTFSPLHYDAQAGEAALSQMGRSGYNVVRVFIDPGDWSRFDGVNGPWDTTPGLDAAYMDNVADFVLRATRHQIYVMPSIDRIPFNAHYRDIITPEDPNIVSWNAFYLHQGHIDAKQAYLEDFIDALASRLGAKLLTTIFAYQLQNELAYYGSYLPFSSDTLHVTTANGKTYDMADPMQRQAAADDNTIRYANTMVNAAHSRDPESLVTIGMFTFQAVGRSGPNGLLPIPPPGAEARFPVRPAILSQSTSLSFLDVHVYNRTGSWSLESDLNSSEWSQIDFAKPVIMGEFGAKKSRFPDLMEAASAMRAQQVESCAYHFSGWLFWTYDTSEQPSLWNLLDGNGAIDNVLAPVQVKNPCSTIGSELKPLEIHVDNGIEGTMDRGSPAGSYSQNYPNPFNPATTITFSLPTQQHVALDVFDVLGRKVATLVDGSRSAGQHTVTFEAANLPSGVYLYRLQTGSFVETRKMFLLK